MLTHLKLNNFKIWRSTGQMNLAPLTLLFGVNSSGKSSLIQSLLLLRQTMKSPDANLDLNFGSAEAGDSVTLGQFRDVLCRYGVASETLSAKQVGIEFGWRGTEKDDQGIFSASYSEGPGGSAELQSLRIGRGLQGFSLRRGDKGAYAVYAADSAKRLGSSREFKARRSFEFPPPAVRLLGDAAADVLAAGPAAVEELSRVIYLGPVRRLAQRDYLWSGRAPSSIGDDGGRAVDALIASGVAKMDAQRRRLPTPAAAFLFDQTVRWLRDMGLADGLQIKQIGKSARYEVLVENKGSASNLKDVGVGVSQVLPVIVAALFAQPGQTVIIEEPESHLHPLAQTQLAELFIALSSERGVQFIVESHSEHLVLRLQRRVAEELLPTKGVAMYYVRRSDDQSTLELLRMNEAGEIENWPDDFFGNEMVDIAARTMAALDRQGITLPGEES